MLKNDLLSGTATWARSKGQSKNFIEFFLNVFNFIFIMEDRPKDVLGVSRFASQDLKFQNTTLTILSQLTLENQTKQQLWKML